MFPTRRWGAEPFSRTRSALEQSPRAVWSFLPLWGTSPIKGGASGTRTHDINTASVALSQLSYGPKVPEYVHSIRHPPLPGRYDGNRIPTTRRGFRKCDEENSTGDVALTWESRGGVCRAARSPGAWALSAEGGVTRMQFHSIPSLGKKVMSPHREGTVTRRVPCPTRSRPRPRCRSGWPPGGPKPTGPLPSPGRQPPSG